MQPDSYDSMREVLGKVGLTGQMQNEDQLIVSLQVGPVYPDRGNSFWLSLKEGAWYLSTWLPAGYKVPASQDILELCLACMSVGTSAMWRVPAQIVSRFKLQELGDEE